MDFVFRLQKVVNSQTAMAIFATTVSLCESVVFEYSHITVYSITYKRYLDLFIRRYAHILDERWFPKQNQSYRKIVTDGPTDR